MQPALEPGDVVITTSGLRGPVIDASYEETVDLEIADGVVTTWLRAAVREKVATAETRRRERAAPTGHDEPSSDEPAGPSLETAPGRARSGQPRDVRGGRLGKRARAAEGRSRTAPAGPADRPAADQHPRPTGREFSAVATSPGPIRPWRYLVAFLGVMVVLYSLVFFTGEGGPRRSSASTCRAARGSR